VIEMRTRTSTAVRRRAARVVAAVAVAGMAIALGVPGGTSVGDAASPFVAGGPVTDRTPVAGDRAAVALARAADVRARLGLPSPATSRVERVVDRFDGSAYDEVTESDATGRALGLHRFDARGRLVGSVAFGWQAAGGPRLPNAAAARARGSRLATNLGLDAAGTPDVQAAPDDTGWTLTWSRNVDGVPVPGDGVRVDLWPDGRMHAIVRTERPLAARPITTLDEATARARGTAMLGTLFGDRTDQVAITTLALAWVAPNSAFDPTGPDAPGTTLRLAWVVEARTSGPLADELRAVKLFLDAGTGALIGGDVLR
jgi:hypothetical protein